MNIVKGLAGLLFYAVAFFCIADVFVRFFSDGFPHFAPAWQAGVLLVGFGLTAAGLACAVLFVFGAVAVVCQLATEGKVG